MSFAIRFHNTSRVPTLQEFSNCYTLGKTREPFYSVKRTGGFHALLAFNMKRFKIEAPGAVFVRALRSDAPLFLSLFLAPLRPFLFPHERFPGMVLGSSRSFDSFAWLRSTCVRSDGTLRQFGVALRLCVPWRVKRGVARSVCAPTRRKSAFRMSEHNDCVKWNGLLGCRDNRM